MAKEVDGIYNTVYLKWAVLMLHFMLPDMPIDVLRDMSSALLYRLSSWDKMGSIDEFELADVTRKFKDYNLPSSVSKFVGITYLGQQLSSRCRE